MKLQIGIDGKSYEVDVEVLEDDSALRTAGYPSHPGSASVPSLRTPLASTLPRPTDVHINESKVCRSPVAGVVLRVNVQPGQKLQPHDLMMVLEAMKMETNVTAPGGGTVKAVSAKPGDAVKVNQVLVEFE